MQAIFDAAERLLEQLTNGAEWWVYLLVLLVPLSMLLAIREAICWFWKVNALVGSLRRVEKQLVKLNERLGVAVGGEEEKEEEKKEAADKLDSAGDQVAGSDEGGGE